MGERIGLSNQQDGSRGLPTAAHWPGSRARYRIIARARRYDAADLSRSSYLSAHLRSLDYPPPDLALAGPSGRSLINARDARDAHLV